MTTPGSNLERVKRVLAEHLKRDLASIDRSHSLREDLGLDSMATIELLYEIEETFDFEFPDEDLEKLLTVENVVAYIDAKLGAAERAGP